MSIPVPYLSDEVIERDAAALLAEYAQARGVTVKPPIPIEDIVEKHLKLRFEFDDTHKLFGIPRDPECDADILGAIFFDEARIVIDESLDPEENPAKEGRFRFTLAHEGGGHWRLHRHLFGKDPTLFGGSAAPSIDPGQGAGGVAGGFLRLMPIDAAQVNFRDLARRFGTTAPFIFEIKKFNPTFARRRSNWIHISKAFETAPDTLKEPDYQIVFNRLRESSPRFSASPQSRCAFVSRNSACCSAKFRTSGRSRSVSDAFFLKRTYSVNCTDENEGGDGECHRIVKQTNI
jgi:hypothetical protein